MVSIVTVNYNGWRDTVQMVQSFAAHETYPYEIIVVDNASRGDDVEQLRSSCPGVKVVACNENLGFAGGNNVGYRNATGDYIFFLNNDTLITGPVLQRLVSNFDHPQVGGVSPILRYAYPPHDVQYRGWEKLTPVTFKTPPRSEPLPPQNVQVMHGAAMMLPRHVIEEVGPQLECFFLYYEEFDVSYRLLDSGYRVALEPQVEILHKEGTKQGLSMTPLRAYYMTRSRILFARIHSRGLSRWLACLYLLAVAMPVNVARKVAGRQWAAAMAVLRGAVSGLVASKSRAITRQR